MKTLILSDLHLGTKASSAGNLLEGIRRLAREHDTVILNGDTLDRFETPGCESNSERHLCDIMDACSSRNGLPEILTGNHDPAISDRQWHYIAQSATLIFHGDCIADCTHPSKQFEQILAARLGEYWAELGGRPTRFVELVDKHRRVQADTARANPPVREPKSKFHYLLHAFFPPQKSIHVLSYWRNAPKLAAALGATFEKPVRNVVLGHTHRPGQWCINGCNVFNTGSFMPMSKPYAFVSDGHKVSHLPLLPLLRSHHIVSLPVVAANRNGYPARPGTSVK